MHVVTHKRLSQKTDTASSIAQVYETFSDVTQASALAPSGQDPSEPAYSCFAPDTRIKTVQGERCICDLSQGDMVLTRDNGFQSIRWIGAQTLCDDAQDPVEDVIDIAQGAFGAGMPDAKLSVSSCFRLLVRTDALLDISGVCEALITAKDLVGLPHVTRNTRKTPRQFVLIILDRHELIQANGLWCETFQAHKQTFDLPVGAQDQRDTPETQSQDVLNRLRGQTYGPARCMVQAEHAIAMMSQTWRDRQSAQSSGVSKSNIA
nr:Hint domain-containing protein [uncultured Shimia sp.]